VNLSRLHDSAYGSPDDVHLIGGESVPSCEITWRARGPDVTPDMRKIVVDSVQTSGFFYCSAVNTWLRYKREYLGGVKVASVCALVSLPQKNCAPFVGLVIAPLSLSDLSSLLRGKIGPSVSSTIAPFLTLAVAVSALVCYTQRAASIRDKKLDGCGLWSFAAMTSSHVGNVFHPH
jgi:hypothetical protein